MTRFLRFTVEQALEGRGDRLKEYLIGIEVYDKPETLDPRYDPIVRVEAGRLRAKLREYYEADGRDDVVVIVFQKRSYAPRFGWNAHVEEMERIFQPSVIPQAEQRGEQISVAVLPFADMSRCADQGHFCDGLTEEIINALAQIDGLHVIARTTAFQYKGKAEDVRKIGRELNVRTVLEGSVREFGQRARITAQLNSCVDGYHVWSETYERELRDPFSLQTEVSRAIASRFRQDLLKFGFARTS